ncbi:MAG: hypothetical protein ACOY0T_15855 [Myxococcota bacterium]
MPSADFSLADAATEPLWLELRCKGTTRVFPFLTEHARAIAVGSVCHADLCVRHPGVYPIHFEFERECDAIALVPAPGADVRVNAAHASDRADIGERARIEFSGMYIEAVVHKRCPFLDMENAVQVLTGSEAEIESQFFLFDEAEPTRVTIPAAQRTLADIGAQPLDTTMFSGGVPGGADVATVPTLPSIEPSELDRAFDALLEPVFLSGPADAALIDVPRQSTLRARCTAGVSALGLFAMRHPILAAGSTLVVGLMLALAAIGVLRVVHAAESIRDSTSRGFAPHSQATGSGFRGLCRAGCLEIYQGAQHRVGRLKALRGALIHRSHHDFIERYGDGLQTTMGRRQRDVRVSVRMGAGDHFV